jgi:hypothetical protein
MITVLTDLPQGVIGFKASGKITKADYTEVLQPALEAAAVNGKIRILLDFADEFDGMELKAVLQDLRTAIKQWKSWERIALVTDHDWMEKGVELFSWAMPGDVKVFDDDEQRDALIWLVGIADAGAADD